MDEAQAEAPGLRTGWKGAPCAGGTRAEPARGISALWAKQNMRGNTTPWEIPGFTGHHPWVNLEAPSIPQPQKRQPLAPVAAASVLGPDTLKPCHVPPSPLALLSLFTSSPLPGQPSSSPKGAELHAKPRSTYKGRHQPQPLHSVHIPGTLPVMLGSKRGSAYLYA